MEVLAALERRKHLLDGVCISGGEPTLQPVADLVKLLSAIKSLGLQVKLDTNGTKPEVLEQLLERDLIDYVAMDIKAPLERYQEVCRVAVDTDAIKRSVEILRRGLVAYEFRTTVPVVCCRKMTCCRWGSGCREQSALSSRPINRECT